MSNANEECSILQVMGEELRRRSQDATALRVLIYDNGTLRGWQNQLRSDLR